MKKKILLAVCAVTAVTAMAVGFTACDKNKNELSAEDAAAKIATFTSSPNSIDATFKQKYKLTVNDERAHFKSFEKDIDDTVIIQADFTAGNVYYYGKKTAKDNTVTEQLVVKEGSGYVYLTSTTVKKTLADEAAAKTKIKELMTSLTKQTSGYVDSDAFVYDADWVHTYLLLGSQTLKGDEKSSFTYKYEKTDGDGLKAGIDMKYVGYYGDAGTFEFGTDATHTGARADIETDSNGYITSFSQTLNNHLDMNITNPAVPLDLAGSRSLSATYNGTITKKAVADITQTLNNPTVTFSNPANATLAVTDMVITGQAPSSMTPVTSGAAVAVGHWIAVKVTPEEGYEADTVKVGGHDTVPMAGQYCYHVTEDDYNVELKVAVTVKAKDPNAPTTGTITVANVEHATVTTYDYKEGDNSTLATPSATVTIGNFVAVKVECESGYEVDTVKVNGENAQPIFGYYCKKVTAAGTYNVVVTLKTAA